MQLLQAKSDEEMEALQRKFAEERKEKEGFDKQKRSKDKVGEV